MTEREATTTILFSDLVGSTELMQRQGDEDAQRLLKAHYQLLRDAVAASGGAEVKSLGDGLMVAFASAADAVRCAIAIQQMSRRPINGERLAIKVGLNAGDALRDESDYFGTSVVVARRLCDRAGPGQILCSSVIASLLAGRQAFSFRAIGELDLKGLSTPVSACEATYETEQQGFILRRTPFVGRDAEMVRLKARLAEARAGQGGLVMLVGEPGIGKSRVIEEFIEDARANGAAILFGACFEGEWSPPYAPFVEAIENYARSAEPVQLRADLGQGAAPMVRLVPALRERLPDVPEPAPLQPDEERFRLLDAVSQFLAAVSRRQPVLLVLDDLHWAERGTIAMLRHVAHFAPRHRTVILGAYRDVELDRQHPLADALSQLRREVEYERISLKGLSEDQVGTLLTTLTEHDVPEPFVHAISAETEGNPFFIREVLIHLADEGKIFQQDGRWTSKLSVSEMGIPEGVRQVIGRRLSRLSGDANKLLTAAAGFNGPFRIDIVGAAAGIDEAAALDAIDAALESQLARPSGVGETFEFTHALIRHTLYAELSPPRQVRLHRGIAEAMERAYGDRATDHAAELAYQFHRSAGLPGTERGAHYALCAADAAEATAAWDEAAAFLRMAFELLLDDDARRPRLMARLGIALMWALQPEEGVKAAASAAILIAAREGDDAAADYLHDAMRVAGDAGDMRAAWALASDGMRYIGRRRDRVWARLFVVDHTARSAAGQDALGALMPVDEPAFEEWMNVTRRLSPSDRPLNFFESREEASRALSTIVDPISRAFAALFFLGDVRLAGSMFRDILSASEREGRIGVQIAASAQLARCLNVLGELGEARAWYDRGIALSARLPGPSMNAQQLIAAQAEIHIARGGGVRASVVAVQALLQRDAPEARWFGATLFAGAARIFAEAGQGDDAVNALVRALATIDRTPAGEGNLPASICDSVWALWFLERTDHIDLIERNLREKVVTPDFRYPMRDGRTALARLCALQERYEEASRWFGEARGVLEEDGARPLRAMVDYDEAVLYARRRADGDRERALPLLDAALAQFLEIGMPGWIRRADELRASLAG